MSTERASDRSGAVDQFLYHYTSIGTAERIVQSKELWATNIYYLNDGSEFTHGKRLMRELLARAADESAAGRDFRTAVEYSVLEYPHLNIFVVSFSEIGDLLSQWRSYCPPNRGVSLGIPPTSLETSAKEQGFEMLVRS